MTMLETLHKIKCLKEATREALEDEGGENAMIVVDYQDAEALAVAQQALRLVLTMRQLLKGGPAA